MAARRKAREFALQMLFQWELGRAAPAQIEAIFWKSARGSRQTKEFANKLFAGAAAQSPTTDALIASHAKNWRLERMSAVDRNILRLAVHELQQADTPPKVAINEALELAKKYSDEQAVAFVNGVLDAVLKSFASPHLT
jgi:N utilization substance protein B